MSENDETPKTERGVAEPASGAIVFQGPRLPTGEFRAGYSGNPAGRPLRPSILRERIQSKGGWLVEKLLDIVDDEPELVSQEGKRGGVVIGPSHTDRIAAIKVLMAYGYGIPKEAPGRGGNGEEGDLPAFDMSKLTDEEVNRLKDLVAKARGGGGG